VRRLLPKGGEGPVLALPGHHLEHGARAGGADQLVLQIGAADEDRGLGAAGVVPRPADDPFLGSIAENAHPDTEKCRVGKPPPDVRRPTDRDDADPLGDEVLTPPDGEGLERDAVAVPLHQHHGGRTCLASGHATSG
jgi:hypothetical protein